MATKKRLVSGIKPTGDLHIGNYFGALKQFLDYQESYESFIFIADYHALTTAHNALRLTHSIEGVARGFLAIGLDPEKVVLFQQSSVPEHTELAWVFNCITTMPTLMRAHAFKDAEAKNKEISVGTFDYPLLMSADILLYDPEVVPVGKDQKQHVEIARETARKFNGMYGETFTEPQELIRESVQSVPGTDGQKMSKSYRNTIPLFGTKDEIVRAVMSIVTDSTGERPENVYAIHKLVRTEEELDDLYEEHKGNYKALKEALIEDLEAFIAPMRERHAQTSDADVKNILARGSEKARAIASEKIKLVRERVGVVLPA